MIELLKLCGFEVQEIDSELPRVEKAFGKLGITSEDIERGKQRIQKYYAVELEGVRKIFGIYLKELVNLTLAREEGKTKILYPAVYSGCGEIPAATAYVSEDVYATIPDVLFGVTFGCIFDKLTPILETAERQWLKPGVAHCGSIKAKVGLAALGLIPMCDLLVTINTLCDEGPKAGDLMTELFGVPVHNISVCQDRGFAEFPDIKRVADFLEKGLRRYARRVEDVVGFQIDDEVLLEVIRDRGRYGEVLNRIRDLMVSSDPLPISAAHEGIWSALGAFSLNRRTRQAAIDAANILWEELKERVAKGQGVVEKGAPRVFAIQPPSWVDPYLETLAGEVGIAIVEVEWATNQPDGRRVSDVGDVRDPYAIIANRAFMISLSNTPRARISSLIGACRRTGVDGVLARYHIGCRSVLADVMMVKDGLQKELGIPVLLLEIESFDPRYFSAGQYRRRLELFAQMIKAKAA